MRTKIFIFLVHDLSNISVNIRGKIVYDYPPLYFLVVKIHFITILGDHLVIRQQVATILWLKT